MFKWDIVYIFMYLRNEMTYTVNRWILSYWFGRNFGIYPPLRMQWWIVITIIIIYSFIKYRNYLPFRNHSVSDLNQILLTLWFFASSGHLHSVTNFMGVDISTASRIVARVTSALASQFVKLPHQQQSQIASQEFFFLYVWYSSYHWSSWWSIHSSAITR